MEERYITWEEFYKVVQRLVGRDLSYVCSMSIERARITQIKGEPDYLYFWLDNRGGKARASDYVRTGDWESHEVFAGTVSHENTIKEMADGSYVIFCHEGFYLIHKSGDNESFPLPRRDPPERIIERIFAATKGRGSRMIVKHNPNLFLPETFLTTLKGEGVEVDREAADIIRKPPFKRSLADRREYELFFLTTGQIIGAEESIQLGEMFSIISSIGFLKCPAWVGPELMLDHSFWSGAEEKILTIIMNPINSGSPCMFELYGAKLCCYHGHRTMLFHSEKTLAICRRANA
jgi:hypothetical protein